MVSIPTMSAPFRAAPPGSEAELLERARTLAGRSLAELAGVAGRPVPGDLRRAKGWVGELMEALLGASAASRAQPDFESLGVELKTLPVDDVGKPFESTFVCTIPLAEIDDVEWSASRAYRKLKRVLWVPVQGARKITVAERRVGTAFLWSPSQEQESALKFDWEELVGRIGCGDVETITARTGQYLQIRPKAANSRARRRGRDADGAVFATMPKGFYLRATFTHQLLRERFGL